MSNIVQSKHVAQRVTMLRNLGVTYARIGKLHNKSVEWARRMYHTTSRISDLADIYPDQAETPEQYFKEFPRENEIEWWVWQLGGIDACAKRYGWGVVASRLPKDKQHLTVMELMKAGNIIIEFT